MRTAGEFVRRIIRDSGATAIERGLAIAQQTGTIPAKGDFEDPEEAVEYTKFAVGYKAAVAALNAAKRDPAVLEALNAARKDPAVAEALRKAAKDLKEAFEEEKAAQRRS